MVRFWLVCFSLLFVMVELWEWLRELTVAFPLCVFGGIGLAIVSNLNFASTPFVSNHPVLPPESPRQALDPNARPEK